MTDGWRPVRDAKWSSSWECLSQCAMVRRRKYVGVMTMRLLERRATGWAGAVQPKGALPRPMLAF